MSNSRAAIRYAKAILDTAKLKGGDRVVNDDMVLIASTIRENDELNDFIKNPTIKVEVKEKILIEIFSEVSLETKKIFRLLLNNNRFVILDQIAKQYTNLFEEDQNIEKVEIKTAFPITPDMEDKILDKIKIFSKKLITIQNVVDPSVIGGFILRIGDKEYNNSIANRLQVLKREFSN